MKKLVYCLLICLSLLLASCQPRPQAADQPAPVSQAETEASPIANPPLQPSSIPSATLAPPTALPPTLTPSPSIPPQPTSALPPAGAWAITAENSSQLALLAQLPRTHLGIISAAAWAPDGKSLAAGAGQTVFLLDPQSGKIVWKYELEVPVASLIFSPNSVYLAVIGKSNGGILLQTASGQAHFRTSSIVAFSPDGQILADATALRDISSGTLLRELPAPEFTPAQYEFLVDVAFSTDRSQLVGSYNAGGFVFWDVLSGKQTYRITGENAGHDCGGSVKNENWMVLICYDLASDLSRVDAQIWYTSLKQPRSVKMHLIKAMQDAGYQRQPQLSAGTSLLAWPNRSGIPVFDLAANAYLTETITWLPSQSAIAFSPPPAGKLLAQWDGDILRIWDRAQQKVLQQWGEAGVNRLLLNPPAQQLIFSRSDGTLNLWKYSTGASSPQVFLRDRTLQAMAIDSGGKYLATGGTDTFIRLWNLETLAAKPVQERRAYSSIAGLAFQPGGEQLAVSYSSMFYFTLLNANLQNEAMPRVLSQLSSPLLAMAYSPSGKQIVFLSASGGLEVRQSTDGSLLQSLTYQKKPAAFRVSFSPDGTLLASTGGGIWDLNQKTLLLDLPVGVQSLAFSPDQCLFAAGLSSGQIWFWDLANRKLLSPHLAHSQSVSDLAFSPEGHLLYSASLDGSIAVWGLPGALQQPGGQLAVQRCRLPAGILPTLAPTPTVTPTPTRTPRPTLTQPVKKSATP